MFNIRDVLFLDRRFIVEEEISLRLGKHFRLTFGIVYSLSSKTRTHFVEDF